MIGITQKITEIALSQNKKLFNFLRHHKLKFSYLGKPIFFDSSSSISSKSILKIIDGGSISIGKKCEIHDFTFIMTYGGHIRIGNNSSINPFSVIYGHGGLNIGNGVRIAAHTVIIPANHRFDSIDVPIYMQDEIREGITIEDDVWIGAGSRILDGVVIGKGSVIGAGSVVTGSIPQFSVAVGVPARVISTRKGKIGD